MSVKELIAIAKTISVWDVLGALSIFVATFGFMAIGG